MSEITEKDDTNRGNYDGTGAALFKGITDLFRKKTPFGRVDDTIDMDGKTCMVTGSNSGLGRAAALRLARMGADVIMACRSQIPEAGELLRKKSGSEKISMEYMDLTRFSTIEDIAERLQSQGIVLDVLVCNAGMVSQKSRLTPDGFDIMLQVNCLSKYHLINALIKRGVLRTRPDNNGRPVSRVVFVSSEAHRTALPLDIQGLDKPLEYSIKESIPMYGYTKLLLTIFTRELARRYSGKSESGEKLSVFTLCPGAVASNISREAPKIFHPLLKLVFLIFFRSPKKASDPIIFFASNPVLENQSDIYLHLMEKKEADSRTADPETGKALWQRMGELVGR